MSALASYCIPVLTGAGKVFSRDAANEVFSAVQDSIAWDWSSFKIPSLKQYLQVVNSSVDSSP
eukprot:10950659-Karenia_brevis.AAC.1